MAVEIKHELEPFLATFHRCAKLGLKPVRDLVGQYHSGFDLEDVEKALGAERFAGFMNKVKSVFSCGHRLHPRDHQDKTRAGTEAHCIYAHDLEQYLKEGEHPNA